MSNKKSESSKFHEKSFWVVVDVRFTSDPILDPVSKSIYGFIKSLCQLLSKSFSKNEVGFLLISYERPYPWIIELSKEFPNYIKFWSGGPDSFFYSSIGPLWLWPTFVLKRVRSLVDNNFIWVSYRNIDRPLFVSGKNISSNIVQIINNSVPIFNMKGVSVFKRIIYRLFIARAINRLKNNYCTSRNVLGLIKKFHKKKEINLKLLYPGVSEFAGKFKKSLNNEDQFKNKSNVLQILSSNEFLVHYKQLLETISKSPWFLAIGNSDKFYNWDLLYQSLICEELKKKEIWIIRVGVELNEFQQFIRKNEYIKNNNIIIIPKLKIIYILLLDQVNLYYLMSISDLLVHTCQINVSTIFILEAIYCGLPVMYKSNQDIDDFLNENKFEKYFLNKIDSDSPSVWANHIVRFLENYQTIGLCTHLKKLNNTRDFFSEFENNSDYNWEKSASLFYTEIMSKRLI